MTRAATVLMFYGASCGAAESAVARYVEILPDAHVESSRPLPGSSERTPLNRIEFRVGSGSFIAFDNDFDHAFAPTPAMSVWLELEDARSIDLVAERLAEGGGRLLMPADAYGFSTRFAWAQDRWGFSWQLNYAPA